LRVSERVHLVGSGSLGFDLTDPFDCHIYLVDGGSELALVDVGAGMGARAIVENVKRAGFDPQRVRHLILTHAHGDHGGGAAQMRDLLDAPAVHVSRELAGHLRLGNEEALSITAARHAGIYPSSYRLTPCDVDVELTADDQVTVGDLSLQVIDTPGHCDGHLSYLLEHDGERILFGGDVIFFGGKVLMQNIPDCRVDALVSSLRKLRDCAITMLLPGHLTLSLQDGQRHIERANQVLDTLLLPEQLVTAW
jgi:glyoxylase-like metal-dependent hydrolase (beta-lactamase superfamily II)